MRLRKTTLAMSLAMLGLVATPAFETRALAQAPAVAQADPAGDDAANPGPVASDLSPALNPRAIQKAMRKVADWQLRTGEGRFSTDWTFAALYDGLLAASRTTGDSRYHDAVLKFAQRTNWQLGPRFAHADDEAIAQSYLELAIEHPAPERMATMKAEGDNFFDGPAAPANNPGGGRERFLWHPRRYPG